MHKGGYAISIEDRHEQAGSRLAEVRRAVAGERGDATPYVLELVRGKLRVSTCEVVGQEARNRVVLDFAFVGKCRANKEATILRAVNRRA